MDGSAASKYALLIGIDTYQPQGTHPHPPAGVKLEGRFTAGLDFPNLEGPVNDVQAMRAVLTSAKFGFPNDAQHIHMLMDQQATRANILSVMETYVAGVPSGSTVVLYIASHGSLRVNDKGAGQIFLLDGEQHRLDGTIVPADAYLGAEDITSHELRGVLMKAATRGVHVTAIFDSCHSGGQSRGADSTLVKRSLAYDPRPIPDQPAVYKADGSPEDGPQDLKTNPVLILSAAQKDQSALEEQNGKPHGLFTEALVEALQSLPATAKASDVFQRVQVNLELAGASNQQPALDTTAERRRKPLFGGDAESGPLRATVVNAGENTITLDTGKLADIGIGTEFKDITAGNGAILQVTAYDGLERTEAVVVSPKGFQPKPMDLLERTTWVVPERTPLAFYSGPGNVSKAQMDAAVAAVTAAKLTLVKDPSSDPWTHRIFWDGTGWVLQAHGKDGLVASGTRAAVIRLGSALSADALIRQVPQEGIVWFDTPLTTDMTAMPELRTMTSAAVLTEQRNTAQYVAVGNLTPDGAQYAWYSRGELDADVQTPSGFGAGCSPSSPYPLRTSWVRLSTDASQKSLTQLAIRLAKLHMWLTMPANSSDASRFDYSLALQKLEGQEIVMADGKTYKGERYGLLLSAPETPMTTAPRFVYVLGIDCQGTGRLLWPRSGPGGRFPTENGRLPQIPLPGLSFRIAPPFGTDTYILLTTSTELPEPDILNFEGAVRGGSTESPLERLLHAASEGTRAPDIEAPMNWGIDVLQTQSQPVNSPAKVQ